MSGESVSTGTGVILLVAGTRPEIIKLAPVWHDLKRQQVDVAWLFSGQQEDLGRQTFAVFGITPEYQMEIERPTGLLTELHAGLAHGFHVMYGQIKPDLVIVQGDTLTAAVAGMQAFLAGIKLAHVEAGLRSWDMQSPYPEEADRVWVDAVADLKFAPTPGAALTLTGEVYVTGQTAVDTVNMVPAKRLKDGNYAVLTTHRRENWGDLEGICSAMKRLSESGVFEKVYWPVHPNPQIRKIAKRALHGCNGVEMLKPLQYDAMVNLMRYASMVFTDSGGVQEDAATLGVPCLVLRDKTERPEGVTARVSKVVGVKEDRIVHWATWLMSSSDDYAVMRNGLNPYGDGKAGQRVAVVCAAALKGRKVDPKIACWSPRRMEKDADRASS